MLHLLRRIAFLFLTVPLVAQVAVFRRFDGRDGMPQSQVEALLEDRLGFLWVGTHGGVARMGASGIKSFGLAEGLGVGRVRALLEDREGGIWAAQADANLALIRGSKIQVFGAADGLGDPDCLSLGLDTQGRVLVGTRKGLWRYEGGRFSSVPLGGDWPTLSIFSMASDHSGGFWVGGPRGRLGHWTPGRTVEEEPLPEGFHQDDVIAIHLDPAGAVHAATPQGLFVRQAPGRWAAEPLQGAPKGARISSFTMDGRGTFLVGLGEDGLWVQDPQDGARLWTARDGLPEEKVNLGFIDRQGTLWVGTDGEGLHARAVPGLTGLQLSGGEPLGAVLGFLEEGPGRILMGTTRGIFRVQDGKGVVGRWTKAHGLPSGEVWNFAPDGAGGAWLCTGKGLVHWRGDRRVGPVVLPGARIHQVMPWGKGFLVAHRGGLVELDASGRVIRTLRLPEEAGGDEASVITTMGDRALVGAMRGLYAYRDGRLERIYGDAPFSGLRVIHIAVDAAGVTWVGTVRGLFRGDASGWVPIGVEQGLPDAHIYFIQPLPGGGQVVGHGKGITLMRPGRPMEHLNQNLGLYSDETNQGGVLLDARGKLWFGLSNGFCRLDLDQEKTLPDLNPPVVVEARWPKGVAHQPTRLELAPGTSGLQLEFQVAQPLCARTPVYEIAMDGLAPEWQRVGQEHLRGFGRLAGGDYRFRIRASVDGVKWVEGPPLQIRVAVAWFETLLGRLALGLAMVAGLAGVIRWRTRRLKARAVALEAKVEERTGALIQRNEDLERAHTRVQEGLEAKASFTRMVAHDLRSPLTTLMLLADQLALDASDGHAPQASQLDLLRQEAGRIEALLQRLLDQAKAESFLQTAYRKRMTPRQAMEGLPEVLRLKARGRGLSFRFEEGAGCDLAHVEVDPLGIQQVLLNLAGNAFKFTKAGGEVTLRSRVEGGSWILEVADTGRGMSESQIERLFRPFQQGEVRDAAQGWGLGLSIVQNLVETHGGRITVTSAPGQGSTFRVELPTA
ncbi:MAG TPA: ATP-binding protein [Holophagaceae bacterium]|nr:ATP-binding protein [Holophagaceae bacterium]